MNNYNNLDFTLYNTTLALFYPDYFSTKAVKNECMYSYENTRKTWNTDLIIVCQNLIGLYYIPNFKGTGKSLSEVLLLGSTNPQHDKRVFIDLPVQYMKTT